MVEHESHKLEGQGSTPWGDIKFVYNLISVRASVLNYYKEDKMSVSSDVQESANKLVNAAQDLANSAVDLGEEAADVALSAVISANKSLLSVLEALKSALLK